MSTRIFQPYQKIWTQRTPDSNYDSLGAGALPAMVLTGLITEGIGESVSLESGSYVTPILFRGSSEGTGTSIILQSGQYTPAP